MKIIAGKKRATVLLVVSAALIAMPLTATGFKMHPDSDIEKQDSCDDNERERYSLQQVFDMTGAPTKAQIADITGKGDGYIVTLKNDSNTVKVFNGTAWSDQAFAPGANEGISILEKKCKNARELSKGDMLVLNNGAATAYGLEGTDLVPTGAVIYGLPQNATSLATIAQNGNCKLGVYEPGLPYMRIFNLNGTIASETGQQNIPALSEIIEGIEAYPGNKILVATPNTVLLYGKKQGNWMQKDAATLKDGAPTPLPGGSDCTPNVSVCASPYTCKETGLGTNIFQCL